MSFSSLSLTLRTAAATLVAVSVNFGVCAAAPQPISSSRVDPRVARDLTLRPAVDVILHFDAPPELAQAKTADQLAQRRRVIAKHLTHRLAQLAKSSNSDITVNRRFELQPAVAATVNLHGVQHLLSMPELQYVEEDSRWPLHTREGLEVIDAKILHTYGITGDDTAVAIIDTGLDYFHPALGGGEIPNAKVVIGLDTADGDNDPMDCNGHGTAVASIAAGASYEWNPINSFAGGVAPEAHIFAYKASHDDDCSALVVSAVVAAIEHAVLHRVGNGYALAAINISAGYDSFLGPCDSVTSAYAAAVDVAIDAGIAVVASAGNEGLTDAISAPACLSKVISVGAMWDSAPGFTGFGFCLDPACTDTCDDSYRPAYSMTCYSNSSPYLDVLAPAEYLQVAYAGGQTSLFGGTSGAAPYVTGAIALLRDAFPTLNPTHARLLLSTSGPTVRDWRNGLQIPLIDVANALDMSGIALADETNKPLLPSGGGPVKSDVWIEDYGAVGQVEAIVYLMHPDPSVLRVRLVAPDGTDVLLHDQSSGTTPEPNHLDRFGALFAHYPEPDQPAQSLNLFCGIPLHGTWTLEVEDLGEVKRTDTEAQLLGWALRYSPRTSPEPTLATTTFVPVTARNPGLNDTTWRSDIRLFNPSEVFSNKLQIYLMPSGKDGHTAFYQRVVRVPAGSVLSISDYVKDLFGLQQFHGQVMIQGDDSVVVASRIFNTQGENGSYGQFVGGHSALDPLKAGGPSVYLLHLARSAGFRTNLGFAEVNGSQAWVKISLFDSAGALLAHSDALSVEPLSNLQVNQVFSQLGVDECENGVAEIAIVAGSGRIQAYASVVDNATGDAMFIPATRPRSAANWIVPVVARTQGAAGTNWASDIRVMNFGTAAEFELSFQPRQGSSSGFASKRKMHLGYREILQIDDVVGSLFEQEKVVGSLRLTPASPGTPLIVSSRTFNSAPEGSFGQFIPPVTEGFTDQAVIPYVDKNSEFRTNFGLCEVSGEELTFELQLFDGEGHPLGDSILRTVSPWELMQINDVFSELEAPSASGAWLRVIRRVGEGSFSAYASVVDAVTGDAVFVPAQALP